MPRLSIIIPHRRDDARLESTLLSVLENRPDDAEVIVAHDGSYTDPYALGDEVVFVEAASSSTTIELINEGLMAACAPVVHTLLDGVVVHAGWAASAINALDADDELAAVATTIRSRRHASRGVSRQLMEDSAVQRGFRRLRKQPGECMGPQVACGFYRRAVLLALGGFCEAVDLVVADIDFARSLELLELRVDSVDDELVEASTQVGCQIESAAGAKQLAQLAITHDQATPGLVSALTESLLGALRGKLSQSLAWSSGLLAGEIPEYASRIQRAKQQLAQREKTRELRLFAEEAVDWRRAA